MNQNGSLQVSSARTCQGHPSGIVKESLDKLYNESIINPYRKFIQKLPNIFISSVSGRINGKFHP